MPVLSLSIGEERHLISGEASLGRHSSCTVRIADPMVSRTHARIGWNDQGPWLEAVSAGNATRINGRRVEGRVAIHDGDVIALGPKELRAQLLDDPPSNQNTSDAALSRKPPQVGQARPESPDSEPTAAADEEVEASDVYDFTDPAPEAGERDAAIARTEEDIAREEAISASTHLVYRGRVFAVEGETILGRHRDCDIQVRDARASRQHIRVEGQGEEVWAEDLGSANGSELNGQPLLGRKRLEHGDRLTIGSSHLILQIPAAAAAAAVNESSTATDPAVGKDLVGRELGGFRIRAIIGHGSIGTVYRAHQVNLARDVALRVFDQAVIEHEAGFGERVAEQARVSARVSHDNIARIHEVGEDDGVLWCAMELVDGTPLDELIAREGPLDPVAALAVVERLAKALGTAHDEGVHHNDLRPSNVMLSTTGTVKLLDIGMGRILQEGRQGAARTAVVGDPSFMAPEQAQGAEPDVRSDIYSVGCLLVLMLTGEPPFTARDARALLRAHAEDPIPSVSERNPAVPSVVDQLVGSMLAKNADWRFADMDELLEELAAVRVQVAAVASALAKAPTASRPGVDRLAPARQRSPSEAARVLPERRVGSGERRARRAGGGGPTLAVSLMMLGIGVMLFLFIGLPLAKRLTVEPANEPIANHGQQPPVAVADPDQGQPEPVRPQPGNDPPAVEDPWQVRWEAVIAEVGPLVQQERWGRAEFRLERLAAEFSAAPERYRERLDDRLVDCRLRAERWYRESTASLVGSDGNTRLRRLREIRDHALRRDRADAEARYQQALDAVRQRLAATRREALAAIERGDLAALPDLGRVAVERLEGTPLAPLSRRFQRLTLEAAHAPWAGSWALTRDQLLRQPPTDADAALAGGALLLLSDNARAGLDLLLAHRALGSGPLRDRREALLRTEAVILDFSTAGDLAFINAVIGAPALVDGSLTAAPGEATGLVCTAAVGGPSWEVAVDLDLGSITPGAETGCALSLVSGNDSHLSLVVSEEGLTLTAATTNGRIQEVEADPGSGRLEIRITSFGGTTAVYLGERVIRDDLAIVVEDARLHIDCNGLEWRLDAIRVLGPPET